MTVIFYLEIESLKLDLQTKKILKKFKSQVSYNLKYTKGKTKESRVSKNISENLGKKKKKPKHIREPRKKKKKRTQIDRARPGSVACGPDRVGNQT